MRKHQGQVQDFSRLRITLSGIAQAVFKLTQSVCHICLQAVHFSFQEDSLLCLQGHFPSCVLAGFVGEFPADLHADLQSTYQIFPGAYSTILQQESL